VRWLSNCPQFDWFSWTFNSWTDSLFLDVRVKNPKRLTVSRAGVTGERVLKFLAVGCRWRVGGWGPSRVT